MKKILTKLLITSILCAIISTALCFFSILSSNSKPSRTSQKLNEILSEDVLFIIIISQVISRLVQIGVEKKWKNTLSKVFTYISVVLQGTLCIILVLYMLSNLNLNRILLFFDLILNIGCIVFFVRELTKTKKISVEGSYEK